ncbi:MULTISPECIES: pYEATS domain-containing protein [unclassified Mesorhizobium]|uniref:pYEATS domain-containing protein n=1 Tax=unclassified Mesorhizobium TaxID=325217 RepID=UPI0015E3DCD0|nr:MULTISPECIES: pYEATS domain-containing protein [unclassified Mesorhizobium]UCI14731.1 TIR domain-containing protein [Mesorhizobium sp. B2-1-1]
MTYRIEQAVAVEPEYPDDRWRWRVWIDASSEELDRIEMVRYELHPTFPEPVRTVRDRSSKFSLASSGWGEFLLHASIKFKTSGDDLRLAHWLRLSSRPLEGVIAPNQLRVFISYAFSDTEAVEKVTNALRNKGARVVNAVNSSVASGEALQDKLDSLHPDVALVFVGENLSKWQAREVTELVRNDVEIIPIVSPQASVAGDSLLASREPVIADFSLSPEDTADRVLRYMPGIIGKV